MVSATRPPFRADYGIAAGLPSPLAPWSDTAAKLRDARNYWVTTSRSDGRPHAAPVWGVFVENLYLFSTDAASVKGRGFTESPTGWMPGARSGVFRDILTED